MTSNSMIILDEVSDWESFITAHRFIQICSSTSTNEGTILHADQLSINHSSRWIGLALATSLTETFCRSHAFVVIATHFQQLTSVGYLYRNVANYHFDVIYSDQIPSETESEPISRPRHHPASHRLEQLNEENTIVYSYTLRPGICKDLHYGNSWMHTSHGLDWTVGLALASQIEDLKTVVEVAKCVAKYYIRRKEVIVCTSLSAVRDSFYQQSGARANQE